MRAAEWAAWTRTLRWRVAVILGIGAAGGVLGRLLVPRLSLLLGALAAVAIGWGLRFQPSSDAVAWRRGAAGQRRTARLLAPLERHGWAILHDLAVPGSAANIDHLVIGPGGVFVIDSKQYRGRLQLDACRRLWHGRHPLAPALRAVSFEADRAAQVLADPPVVVPILAVHGAQVPAARSWSAACGSCRPGSQTDSCTAARHRRPTGLGRGRPPVPRVGQRATMLPGAA